MPEQVVEIPGIRGLTAQQVVALQKQFGKNVISAESQNRLLHIILGIIKEPMFILLSVACSLYFILGEGAEGIMMAVAMVIVTLVSLYQEFKSSRALESLKQYVEPKITVIRDDRQQVISDQELVPGDIILLEEGMKIPADSIILQSNDLSVNEAIITGESLPVDKNVAEDSNKVFQGSTINSGKCIARVSATGNHTELGRIGKSIEGYKPVKTLLQQQVNKFVRRLALFGLVAFFLIFIVNYLHYEVVTVSLLFALTLAMSAVPEEIPVAFSSFMALGAYKMSRLGIISRQPQVIENLGAITVLCLDKTGTITENKMQVKAIYDVEAGELLDVVENRSLKDNVVLQYAALASERDPFDAMEKAIWELYDVTEKPEMIHEYPLEGKPPMMTHVYRPGSDIVVAAKGSPERILRVAKLDKADYDKSLQQVQQLASKGYRVLGVAAASYPDTNWPEHQDDFEWKFLGLVALYDPPKANINKVLTTVKNAGIDIKLLTGDYAATAMNIAGQAGMGNNLRHITGTEIMAMQDDELQQVVKNISIFARMFPDAKVKVIKALKAGEEIVAMTGDGVNDGPALKIADIGIAMGKRGTETARQASDLIISDDDLGKIVSAVSEGRKIFNNLVKAIRYIISIHIPIILTASVPLLLGWQYPNIFTPIHVIFLELIMGPTCSIFFEREPVEQNLMSMPPRKSSSGLFTRQELGLAIAQGLAVTAGILGLYYYFMNQGYSIVQTRTVVFTGLIISNLFLTFADRSYTKTIFVTVRYRNSLAPVIVVVSIIFLVLLFFSSWFQDLFQVTAIPAKTFGTCLLVAFVSVGWFELYKGFRRS